MTCKCKACEDNCALCLDGHFQSAFAVPSLYTSLRGIPDDDIETEAIDSLLEMLMVVADTLHDNISRDNVDFDWVGVPVFQSLRSMMNETNFVKDYDGFYSIAPEAPLLMKRWLEYGGLKLAVLKILAHVRSPNVYHMKLQELLTHFGAHFFQGPDKGGLLLPVLAYGAKRVSEDKKFSPVGIIARVIHSYDNKTTGGLPNGG